MAIEQCDLCSYYGMDLEYIDGLELCPVCAARRHNEIDAESYEEGPEDEDYAWWNQ